MTQDNPAGMPNEIWAFTVRRPYGGSILDGDEIDHCWMEFNGQAKNGAKYLRAESVLEDILKLREALDQSNKALEVITDTRLVSSAAIYDNCISLQQVNRKTLADTAHWESKP